MADPAAVSASASSPGANTTDDTGTAATAAAAAAAEAARNSALSPEHRAVEGYRIAAGSTPPGAGVDAVARADAAASARTALQRNDLDPATTERVHHVVTRLGNDIVDGRLAPHISNEFRERLYQLATEPANSADFKQAISHLTRAAEVLDRERLAPGTRLAFDPQAGTDTRPAGLPTLEVPRLDADLYYQTLDGTLHVESTKYGTDTLADTVKDSRERPANSQLARQAEWERAATPEAPRQAHYYSLATEVGFHDLMNTANLDELSRRIDQPEVRNIVLGERAYSLGELRALDAAVVDAADRHVAQLRAADPSLPVGQAYQDFYRSALATPEAAMRTAGLEVGAPAPQMGPRVQAELPGARTGAAWGAGAGLGLSLIHAGADGRLTLDDAREIATQTAVGAGVGAVTAQAERAVVPLVDRAIGPTVQAGATRVAAQTLGRETAEAVGTGLAVRTAASRIAGGTVVGTVISTGLSAYDNREGLARGDSRAIGNVAADTAVGLGSVAAATAAGAAVGSVVPVAGTAVGAVVGLGVGIAVTYGAQISGARDAIASTVSGWVDGIKSWF